MDKAGLIFVKPVEGRTVRDWRTKLTVPAEGMFVQAGDPHWMSSLNFGDLVTAEPPEEPTPAAPAETAAAAEPAPAAPPAATPEPAHYNVLPPATTA